MRQVKLDIEWRRQTVIGVLAWLILLAHMYYYYPFFADDSFISLRYADRLLNGHGLTWSHGRPVEGYSNLLWILVVSALGYLGMDLVSAARITGCACMAATGCALLYRFANREEANGAATWVSCLFLALAPPIAVWGIGGLEQPLILALLTWAIVVALPLFETTTWSVRRVIGVGALLAPIAVTRPDGILFAVSISLAFLLWRGLSTRAFLHATLIGVLPVTCYLIQLGFRLWYYGEFLPNTAYVKISPSWIHAVQGVSYVLRGLFVGFPLTLGAILFGIMALFGIGRTERARGGVFLVAVPSVLWLSYVSAVGGDIFAAWRHLVPLYGAMALVLGEAMRWLSSGDIYRRHPRFFTFLWMIAFGCYFVLQSLDATNHRGKSQRWVWTQKEIAASMLSAFPDDDILMAVTRAGTVPYWTKWRVIDMYGLNDYHIARTRPKHFGTGYIGHELGDAAYILDQKPDFIQAYNQKYFQETPEIWARLNREYDLCRLTPSTNHALPYSVYVRRESEHIGIARSETQIRVPAYFMNDNPDTNLLQAPDGVFEAIAEDGVPVRLSGLPLDAGTWMLTGQSDLSITATVLDGRTRERLAEGELPLRFTHTSGEIIDVEFSGQGKPVRIRNLGMDRVSEADYSM